MFLESELPFDWDLLSKNESVAMEVELARETCSNHILHNKSVNAIAVKTGFDEVLFSFGRGVNYIVVVNMTWKYEVNPELPKVRVFDSKSNFLEKCDED